MKHYHAAIWIDHNQARVFSLNASEANEWTVRPHDRHLHLHHKAGKGDASKAPLDKHYFHSVADAVKDAGEIVIFGPGTAKTELMHHMQTHDPAVASKVVGVEPVDHPTDGELMNVAKKFFHGADRMRPL